MKQFFYTKNLVFSVSAWFFFSLNCFFLFQSEIHYRDFSEEDLETTFSKISDKELFKSYLEKMYHLEKPTSYTNESIRKIGNPDSDSNLIAALAVRDNFSYSEILWEEDCTDCDDVSDEDAFGKTYRKQLPNSKRYFSMLCTGTKVWAWVWKDQFRGGCNPQYFVKKQKKKVCIQKINCK